MESLRCLRIAPLAILVAAGALGLGGPASLAAGDPPWDPPACGAVASGPPGAAPAAWYRLDPVLDSAGTLSARRLVTGVGGGVPRHLDLGPESFASGPAGGLVLVGDDDGTTSHLRILDPARGCATAAGEERSVIRSAVLAAGAGAIYEHRVDRATRADLGVWRRPVPAAASWAGNGAWSATGIARGMAVRVLDGLGPDPVLGPTFATDLIVAPDGRLVVSSCALRACRVRVLDPGTGSIDRVDRTGPALGVTGGRLVVRAACTGLPCGVEAITLANGARTTLVADAGAAVLGGPAGADVVFEAAGGLVGSVDARTGRRGTFVAAGGTPIRGGSTATGGAEASPGVVAVGPGGRPDGAALRGFEPALGRAQSIVEVSR